MQSFPSKRGGCCVRQIFFPLVSNTEIPGGLSRAAVLRAVKGNGKHSSELTRPGIQQIRPHQLVFLSGLTFEEIASIIKGQYLLVLGQASPEQGGKI